MRLCVVSWIQCWCIVVLCCGLMDVCMCFYVILIWEFFVERWIDVVR
jgi:hypothetical protein